MCTDDRARCASCGALASTVFGAVDDGGGSLPSAEARCEDLVATIVLEPLRQSCIQSAAERLDHPRRTYLAAW